MAPCNKNFLELETHPYLSCALKQLKTNQFPFLRCFDQKIKEETEWKKAKDECYREVKIEESLKNEIE